MESSQSMPEKAPDEVAIQIWTGHQERSSEHERQRLEFTSVVVGASLVAIATDRWPDLVAFASTVKRPHDRAHLIGRELLQRTLHLVVALAAIVLIVAG